MVFDVLKDVFVHCEDAEWLEKNHRNEKLLEDISRAHSRLFIFLPTILYDDFDFFYGRLGMYLGKHDPVIMYECIDIINRLSGVYDDERYAYQASKLLKGIMYAVHCLGFTNEEFNDMGKDSIEKILKSVCERRKV